MAKPALILSRLEKIVHGFARVRLLVVGDVMLDEYLWGDVERVSPEAPVPVVHVRRESHALGGAGNVVRNVVAMGARCGFCAVVGEDTAGDRIVVFEGNPRLTGSIARVHVTDCTPTTLMGMIVTGEVQHGSTGLLPILA